MKSESEPLDKQEVSKEDRERIEEEQMALVDALCRRDIMEHLYLFETWYRDALVYSATGDAAHILNRDREALLETAGPLGDPIGAIGGIQIVETKLLIPFNGFEDIPNGCVIIRIGFDIDFHTIEIMSIGSAPLFS